MKSKTFEDKGNQFGLCKPGRAFAMLTMLNTGTEALVIEKRVQEITEEMREDDE